MRLSIILSAVLILLLGCANSPKVPENLTVDTKLPRVANIEYISDINSVGFEWSSVKDPTVAGFLIYRGEPEQKLDRVGAVDNRFATHFVDSKDILPNHNYIYRFSLYTSDGRESVATDNLHIKTKPLLEPVSFIESVPNLPRMSKIIFRPHPSERIGGYVIERREASEEKWKNVGELKGRLNAEFFDKNLKDNTEYEYRVVAKTYDGILLDASDIVITVTKPLPEMVSGLTASSDLAKKIEIKWQKVPNDGNGSYNLYASSYERIGFAKMGSFKTTGAVEKIDEDGATRYYKVTFMDADGLESIMQDNPIKGSTLQKPNSPTINKIAYEKGEVNLAWAKGDERNIKYTVKRVTVMGIMKKDEKIYRANELLNYTDKDVKAGVTYQYTVIGIDKHGIESKESESARITIDSTGAN